MFFEEMIKVRISKEVLERIYTAVEKDNGERFDNNSHFIRCAIMEKLRKENNRGKK